MCCSFASVLRTNTKQHMIKRLLLISTVCFSLTAQSANLDREMVDTISISGTTKSEQWLHRLEPTYLRNVTLASGFRDNWFVTVGGGVSAFEIWSVRQARPQRLFFWLSFTPRRFLHASDVCKMSGVGDGWGIWPSDSMSPPVLNEHRSIGRCALPFLSSDF